MEVDGRSSWFKKIAVLEIAQAAGWADRVYLIRRTTGALLLAAHLTEFPGRHISAHRPQLNTVAH
jgi:hypothetical protein